MTDTQLKRLWRCLKTSLLSKKEVCIDLRDWDDEIFREALSKGITSYYCDPINIPPEFRQKLTIYSDSPDGDILVIPLGKEVQQARRFAVYAFVQSYSDIEKLISAAKLGAEALIVDTKDWKIIPLENIIAYLHKTSTKLVTKVSSPEEIETMYGILEKGVDVVLFKPKNKEDIGRIFDAINYLTKVQLSPAEVTEIKDVGMGDRACVDTVSILLMGEGMLVGSKASFLFLIHNESLGSSFTEPRPFRINAGAIHSYVLTPTGVTKYLSEIKAGDRVLIINTQGSARSITVGRVKIERRPLRLVKAKVDGEEGTVILQNAETIRLVGADGKPISVTEIKPGDKVLAYISKEKARHFGVAVDEFIIER
ncbi:MAG: 3-dehydroquinate synthase II [Nitrososphaerota archaeon]|nr:3-dehydroquinate synthase II [Aigarchaeota archaeon]MDW8076616.1 3-dehydroquinate synthase II [Nitrososphaerota archaeon]